MKTFLPYIYTSHLRPLIIIRTARIAVKPYSFRELKKVILYVLEK